jgi:outer membrane protein assembly factor BamB
VDRATGKKLWDAKVGKSGAPSGYAGPRCTPTVSGNLVYAEGQFGDLVCVDTEGKEQWRKSFPTDFKGRAGGWGFSESPLVDGDSLICTPGGPEATVVSLDKKTGAVQWKGVADKDEKAGYSSLVIAEIGKVKQYVTLLANSVSSFDAATGKLLWRYGDTKDRFAGNTANIPTCIVIKDQIFCCAGYGRGGALITITADAAGAFKAEEVYYSDKLKNKHGGVVLVGDKLYGDRDDSGNPWCAEFKTGKVVDGWDQKNVKTKGGGSVSVTYADGRLYFRYSNGLIALAAATPDGYQEISTFKIPKPDSNSWPHPVVVGGKLWLREQDNLYCYDVKEK